MVILDDLGEKETFWGGRTGFCNLERVAKTSSGGLPPLRTPQHCGDVWGIGFFGGGGGGLDLYACQGPPHPASDRIRPVAVITQVGGSERHSRPPFFTDQGTVCTVPCARPGFGPHAVFSFMRSPILVPRTVPCARFRVHGTMHGTVNAGNATAMYSVPKGGRV